MLEVVERLDVVTRFDASLGELAQTEGQGCPGSSARGRETLLLESPQLLGIHGLDLGVPELLLGIALRRSQNLGAVTRHVSS